jgi:hypothetical protein
VTRVIVVRHGQTEWNVKARIQGQATATSRRKASRRRDRSPRASRGSPSTCLVASDLGRASATAQVIADAAASRSSSTRGLRERAFGVGEGMTYEEVDRAYPGAFARIRNVDPDFVDSREARAGASSTSACATPSTPSRAAHPGARWSWSRTAACWPRSSATSTTFRSTSRIHRDHQRFVQRAAPRREIAGPSRRGATTLTWTAARPSRRPEPGSSPSRALRVATRQHRRVARLDAREDVVVVADVVHELHRLAAARVAVLERLERLRVGELRDHLAHVLPLVGIEVRALREDARVLEVADADVVGGERQPRAVRLVDARGSCSLSSAK